jgi:hypothetical protein
MPSNLFRLAILGPLSAAAMLLSACTPVMGESATSTGDASRTILADTTP